jgi:hypothetical protein
MVLSIPAAIRRTRQELAESEARTEQLRVRLKALEEAASEFGGEERRSPVPEGTEARTDAILGVMQTRPTSAWTAAELKGPVGSRRNSVEASKDLAAALSYLRDRKKVWSPRRGEWMLAGVPDEREVLIPDDPDDVPF